MPVKPEFIFKSHGKDTVLFAGLLDLAHEQGLSGIKTTLVQVPSDANGQVAIVHASATTSKGTFDGIGDASPGNVGSMIRQHIIRMAETRAKARALRDATNVGVTAFEEMGPDDDDHPPAQSHANGAARQNVTRGNEKPKESSNGVQRSIATTTGELHEYDPARYPGAEKIKASFHAKTAAVEADLISADDADAMTGVLSDYAGDDDTGLAIAKYLCNAPDMELTDLTTTEMDIILKLVHEEDAYKRKKNLDLIRVAAPVWLAAATSESVPF